MNSKAYEFGKWAVANCKPIDAAIVIHLSWGASPEEVRDNLHAYMDKYPYASDSDAGFEHIRGIALLSQPMPDGPPKGYNGLESGRKMLDFFTDRIPASVMEGD